MGGNPLTPLVPKRDSGCIRSNFGCEKNLCYVEIMGKILFVSHAFYASTNLLNSRMYKLTESQSHVKWLSVSILRSHIQDPGHTLLASETLLKSIFLCVKFIKK